MFKQRNRPPAPSEGESGGQKLKGPAVPDVSGVVSAIDEATLRNDMLDLIDAVLDAEPGSCGCF